MSKLIRSSPDIQVVEQRHVLIPEFDLRNVHSPGGIGGATTTSTWSQDTTTTAVPTHRKSTLCFRHGWNDTGMDLHVAAICMPIYSANVVAVVGSLKSRFAVFQRDFQWETSASVKGIPNNSEPLFTTGAGITFDAARAAWCSTGSGGNSPTVLRYDVSGGMGIIPAGAAFTIARLDQCAYTHATPGEAPTLAIYGFSNMLLFGQNRCNRLSPQIEQRPSIYINDLIGNGTSTGIDDFSWTSATAMNAKPAGDWTSFTDAQLNGTTHLVVVSGGLQTGGTLALTSGTIIKSSLPWCPLKFLCLEE